MIEISGEKISSMPAGPEMDALIAEFMGQELARPLGENWVTHEMAMDACDMSLEGQSMGIEWEQIQPYPYSTDITAVWQVVEKFAHKASNKLSQKQGFSYWQLNAYPDSGWACRLGSVSANADTAPLAICRTALLIWMEEKEKEKDIF